VSKFCKSVTSAVKKLPDEVAEVLEPTEAAAEPEP